MTEAHDENSINTDLTFDSGDENVRIPNVIIVIFYLFYGYVYVCTSGRCNKSHEHKQYGYNITQP